MFKYGRTEHAEYLKNLTREGTYEEYQHEVSKLKELGAKIREKGFSINIVMDQADGVYWGDILFHLNCEPNELNIPFKAGEICGTLSKLGVKVSPDAIYYNRRMNGLMYTMVAIKADDGPELYPEEVRLNRDTFLIR